MRDNDELFTIEIKINLNIPEKKKEAPAKQETTLREDGRGQFVLFAEAERKRQEEKRKEYLRLRESIFNRTGDRSTAPFFSRRLPTQTRRVSRRSLCRFPATGRLMTS